MKYLHRFNESNENNENIDQVALKLYPQDLYEEDYGSVGDYNKENRDAFKAGIKWQSDRSYNRQDLIDFVYFINDRHKYESQDTVDTDEVDLFIEERKKK